MNHLARLFVAFLLLTTSVVASEPKTVRILTIGNSFSANATKYLNELAKAGGHTLIHNSLVIGGSSFQVHADKAKAEGKVRLYSNGKDLIANLTADRWDYVTIQQASIKSHDYGTYQPHAGFLRDLIVKHAPQAKLLIHQTWAYRVDDPRFAVKAPKPGEPKTREEMYRGLTAAYERLAAEFGAKIIPVGDAFFRADTDAKWGFKLDPTFDPKQAKHPSLPDQRFSLHVRRKWQKNPAGEMTLSMDGHHASTAGQKPLVPCARARRRLCRRKNKRPRAKHVSSACRSIATANGNCRPLICSPILRRRIAALKRIKAVCARTRTCCKTS